MSKRRSLGYGWRDGAGALRSGVVSGQTARTLAALKDAGEHGITALEMGAWALRLAAYIRDLRKLGFDIETIREGHDTADGAGWHGRYVLRTPVALAEAA